MQTNIALIGFMGTGKSAVGKILARKLGRRFVEVDALIEEMAGKTIPDIFRQHGEIAFREIEIEAVKRAASGQKQVIACGGGIVLNTINIARLRQTSVLVLLTAPPAAILKRTAASQGSRPLLADMGDPLVRIQQLLRFRRPYYERAADVTVNTSRLSVEAVAEQIIEELKDHEGFDLSQ